MSFGSFIARNFGNAGLRGFDEARQRGEDMRQSQIRTLEMLRQREQGETADSMGRADNDFVRSGLYATKDTPLATGPVTDYEAPPAPVVPVTPQAPNYASMPYTPSPSALMVGDGPTPPAGATTGGPATVKQVPPRPVQPVRSASISSDKHGERKDTWRRDIVTWQKAAQEWDAKYAKTHTADGNPIGGAKLIGSPLPGAAPAATAGIQEPSTAQPGQPAAPGAASFAAPEAASQLAQQLNFAGLEQQYGLPKDYLLRTLMIENPKLDPNAVNGSSGATGLFQFVRSTASQYGVNARDPASSADGAARLAAANKQRITQALGREPEAWELYMAHQQGADGFVSLMIRPQATAIDALSHVVKPESAKTRILNNGGTSDMTAQEFMQKFARKFNAVASGAGLQNGAGGSPAANYIMKTADNAVIKPAEILKTFKPGKMTDPGVEYNRLTQLSKSAEMQFNELRRMGGSPEMIMGMYQKVEALRMTAKRAYWESSVFALQHGDPAMIDGILSEQYGAKIRHFPLDNQKFRVVVNGETVGDVDAGEIADQARRFFDEKFVADMDAVAVKNAEYAAKAASEIAVAEVKIRGDMATADLKGQWDQATAVTTAMGQRAVAQINADSRYDLKRYEMGAVREFNDGSGKSYIIVPNRSDPRDFKLFSVGDTRLISDGMDVTKPVMSPVSRAG